MESWSAIDVFDWLKLIVGKNEGELTPPISPCNTFVLSSQRCFRVPKTSAATALSARPPHWSDSDYCDPAPHRSWTANAPAAPVLKAVLNLGIDGPAMDMIVEQNDHESLLELGLSSKLRRVKVMSEWKKIQREVEANKGVYSQGGLLDRWLKAAAVYVGKNLYALKLLTCTVGILVSFTLYTYQVPPSVIQQLLLPHPLSFTPNPYQVPQSLAPHDTLTV